MDVEVIPFYVNDDGDVWYLARAFSSGNVFIRYQANFVSGGHTTDIETGLFLSLSHDAPEKCAFLELIGSLVVRTPQIDSIGPGDRDT